MSSPFPLPDVVLGPVRARHPREIMRLATAAMARAEGLLPGDLTGPLMAADKKGGSAIGGGVAVVSARVPSSAIGGQRLCAFVKLARPVAFRGIDLNPCDLVFIMVSPEENTQNHLRDLSSVIRTLRDKDFTARLRAERAPERILSLFQARDQALRAAA